MVELDALRKFGLIGASMILVGAFLPWVRSGLWFQSGVLPEFAVLGIESVYGIVILILVITALSLIMFKSLDVKTGIAVMGVGILGFGIGVWNALNLHEVAELRTSVVDFGIDIGLGLYLIIIGSFFLMVYAMLLFRKNFGSDGLFFGIFSIGIGIGLLVIVQILISVMLVGGVDREGNIMTPHHPSIPAPLFVIIFLGVIGLITAGIATVILTLRK